MKQETVAPAVMAAAERAGALPPLPGAVEKQADQLRADVATKRARPGHITFRGGGNIVVEANSIGERRRSLLRGGRHRALSQSSSRKIGAHYSRGRAGTQVLEAIEARANRHGWLWRCWHHAFDPASKARIRWDTFMLALVVYSCFAVPYKTAFLLESLLRDHPDSLGMDIQDVIVDILFYIDLVLNFWTVRGRPNPNSARMYNADCPESIHAGIQHGLSRCCGQGSHCEALLDNAVPYRRPLHSRVGYHHTVVRLRARRLHGREPGAERYGKLDENAEGSEAESSWAADYPAQVRDAQASVSVCVYKC